MGVCVFFVLKLNNIALHNKFYAQYLLKILANISFLLLLPFIMSSSYKSKMFILWYIALIQTIYLSACTPRFLFVNNFASMKTLPFLINMAKPELTIRLI